MNLINVMVNSVIMNMYMYNVPYSLDQTPRLLFISSPEFVRRLLIPVAAREAILRETVD